MLIYRVKLDHVLINYGTMILLIFLHVNDIIMGKCGWYARIVYLYHGCNILINQIDL